MKLPFRRILVAVDFSEPSDRALDGGLELARRFGAELHLVHAYDVPVPMLNPYAVSVPPTLIGESRNAAQRKLEETAARARDTGTAVQVHMVEVPAAPAITRVAEEIGADLIVTATHGHTGLKHLFLGSVAERTARLAPCSVLSVRGHALLPLRKVAVGIDFSEVSETALGAAIELAKPFGAQLHPVHAFDLRVPFLTPYEVSVPERLIAEAREAAARKLDAALERARSAGLRGDAHLEDVPAASALARVAGEIAADLVVVGTHGHGGLQHLLLGSVAERTLRIAPCSVLVVKGESGD